MRVAKETFQSFSGTPSQCNCKAGEECKWSVPIGSCEDTSSCTIPALPGVQSVECTIDNGNCFVIVPRLINIKKKYHFPLVRVLAKEHRARQNALQILTNQMANRSRGKVRRLSANVKNQNANLEKEKFTHRIKSYTVHYIRHILESQINEYVGINLTLYNII